MRTLFWVLGLFAAAVGLVLAARYNTGYVLLALPDRRIELSLNLAAILIAVGFVAAYFALRALFLALRLPAEARRFQGRRRFDKGRAAFMEALQAYFEGRFGRAERSAAMALGAGEAPILSAVIAARAAHEMRAFEKRDRYLAQAEADNADENYLRLITQAELLLDERRHHDGLAVLKQLGAGHTAAIRLELKAQQLARNWDRVLTLLPQLENKRVFDPVVIAQLRRTATAENLKRVALDVRQLREAWERLPSDLKRDPVVARTAAEGFASLGSGVDTHRAIETALEDQWDAQLVALYPECPGGDIRDQIQRAERWLPAHPRDAVLLLALGRLCAQAGLWGKARNYFEASLAVEPSHMAHLELAQLAERAGQLEDAAAHRRSALELALVQLRTISGGRRRTLL
ncbi:MAG: heme biosynthesis HemY N-terminal domain-containing protein [Betaproteobacteria bacterium]